MSDALSTDNILPLIQTIRGQRVILAVDFARLYGVQAKRLNESVKRNKVRFPSDFMFQLTRAEALVILRSQNATLKSQGVEREEHQDSRSQFATLNAQGANVKHLPYAFTEHGAIMAANVFNSPEAVAMSVYIVRAFVQQREVLAANDAILKRLAEIDQTLLLHDEALRDIYQKLLPLLQPPPEPPKPRIGFREIAPRYGSKKRQRF
jgi:hypothetical protein